MSDRDKRIIFVSAMLVLVAVQAFAFDSSEAGANVGSEFYQAAVGLAKGYVGKTIALGGIASGLFMLFKGAVLPACGCAIAGIGFAKAGTIVETMGFTC